MTLSPSAPLISSIFWFLALPGGFFAASVEEKGLVAHLLSWPSELEADAFSGPASGLLEASPTASPKASIASMTSRREDSLFMKLVLESVLLKPSAALLARPAGCILT